MIASPVAVTADAPPTAPGRVEWATFTGAAGSRRYRLYLPAGYDERHPAPLVLMLHGCTQDAEDFARGTRMDAVADAQGLVLAYPEQPASAQVQKCWSWYDPAQSQGPASEAELLAGIVADVAAKHAVDRRRTFVVGISAGGAMALNLAAAHPELFAGVVVHSGIAFGAAQSVPAALAAMQGNGLDAARLKDAAAAVLARGHGFPPLLVIHGVADPVARVANGEALARQWIDAQGLHAVGETATEQGGGLAFRRARWADAHGAVRVETIFIEGLGHAWSGGSVEGTFASPTGPDASREAARFLLAQPGLPR
ncbi:MAG TPA: PHB depolymerase family esterase [Longimicrobiaceae bacterium]|nr:PHB depolymerase family esterase [Longimicrobiaceae bacterium]